MSLCRLCNARVDLFDQLDFMSYFDHEVIKKFFKYRFNGSNKTLLRCSLYGLKKVLVAISPKLTNLNKIKNKNKMFMELHILIHIIKHILSQNQLFLLC